uniref:Predicted RNA binding protein YcfA, dsRBD-like fold, HicA-like mRNA interferase family n=1 Tax=Candidatus Kentrum sp. TUN TaxID=2126343 RepID=A0A451B1L1_9GAMM|nr:MAG: Predicted RNA binding protein YcfA, dsRBD-like fold, HicA-like mRNA interferase family [Candidatus Kentron sp. TUN]VFK63295.1 MAG: Predicted RNA binding protein YcfA, dsRBD-like fold, HicA-like mRNA interferase family [Candidatus Kentron sp. TUN]VFK72173.1 MAG: Predicted RNA binding protein YcfA, dsRBD-like fold, HicA-like mRNA interferase family [Candidatus Kentron sp. TUN]
MTSLHNVDYRQIIRALQRDGWIVVRQKGSHIRLQKHMGKKTLKVTVPAHRTVDRSTLSSILRQAHLDADRFMALL